MRANGFKQQVCKVLKGQHIDFPSRYPSHMDSAHLQESQFDHQAFAELTKRGD